MIIILIMINTNQINCINKLHLLNVILDFDWSY